MDVLAPHYPAKTEIEDLFRKVIPGLDEYVTEKYAFEIRAILTRWSDGLRSGQDSFESLSQFLDPAVEFVTFRPSKEVKLRSENGVEILKRHFLGQTSSGRERFLQEVNAYMTSLSRLQTAEFEIVGIKNLTGALLRVECQIRYDFVGLHANGDREQRVGYWRSTWMSDDSRNWRAQQFVATSETLCRVNGPGFIDVTTQAFGRDDSYRKQLLNGADYWRTVLDGACGIDVYGNNGVAAGDFDNDGFDDIYICQPAGLPNRLYRNRGDGTFEDVTANSGLDVLDSTACALFADFENKGVQDLLVVCGNGPLLFLNQGGGKFSLKRDAFKFSNPPEGTFTHAAVADYDHDGRLDIYFCLYSYYLGLDQYHYPAPYFDARNGPPNFLLHNEGSGTFRDRTEAAGLNVENNRYSFSCAWGDSNSDGWPDLYVANDFGRGNLYRNNGDGTFSELSREANVQDAGAGMSACWLDFDGDGKQDIYVSNMWSAAGLRVSEQENFHEKDSENVRAYYQTHARGNSLYQNLGDGKFKNVAGPTGVEMGRWAWSSDSWDFDHDGYPDLYIANGYISGANALDLSSFFWRLVVAQSPSDASPSPEYERGWNAINELVRTDDSWSGLERNVFYANNGDGTFSDISGAIGLDFRDDSRSFSLADIDHDGRLEMILKNRNGPQIRILRNAMKSIGNSIAIRLRGVESNRDAVGAAITIETGGLKQTKYLQAGSGFLSQHSKEIFFGVGSWQGNVNVDIRWPRGQTQTFSGLKVNQRINFLEGSSEFHSTDFATSPEIYRKAEGAPTADPLPEIVETWLLRPLSAPQFELPDADNKIWSAQKFRGRFLLLTFCRVNSEDGKNQLSLLSRQETNLATANLQVVAINVDASQGFSPARAIASQRRFFFPFLLATDEVAGIYNLLYRYVFDRHRDLPIPTSFLINADGMIVKIYQGAVPVANFLRDATLAENSPADRAHAALPFDGTLYKSTFGRNAFTYGVAFFQHGYLNQAAESFKQAIANKPEDAEANYNLGTLYLRQNDLAQAREHLQQAANLRPDYPEAWNNLGMLAAQEGHTELAVDDFQKSLSLRPNYVVAMVNLGNLYRRERSFSDAQTILSRAFELEPQNPEVAYNLGMLYAQQNDMQPAEQYLSKAVSLRFDYSDARNNLGVLYVREQRYPAAEENFKECIKISPDFDQAYMNLARLYLIENEVPRAREVLLALLRRQPGNKGASEALDLLH